MNFNRMTIRDTPRGLEVYKMKPCYPKTCQGAAGGPNPISWYVSVMAMPLFNGTQAQCEAYIASKGAEYHAAH